ncbi:MAG: hypothetical protein HYY23_12705 [Verrucomicrobia bacterium]|nr:hypothetical protein [Verrucomicrobiota bacterium]
MRRWLHKPEEILGRLEMYEALNAQGKFLLVEPKIHIGSRQFEKEVDAALAANFKLVERPAVRLSLAALFAK